MKYNNNYCLQDLFMNKKLAGVFPQFTKEEQYTNMSNKQWVVDKIQNYIKKLFNGKIRNGDVIIYGDHNEKMREIQAIAPMLEELFKQMPNVYRFLGDRTGKLRTPFQSLDQLKELQTPLQKTTAMQIVLDNMKYNPAFQKDKHRQGMGYFAKQKQWLKETDTSLRRNIWKE